MKLEEQKYYIQIENQVEIKSHRDVLWATKQIIRLQKKLFQEVDDILSNGGRIALFNAYNPINNNLINDFVTHTHKKHSALLWEIVGRNKDDNEPIINGHTLQKTQVLDMNNISLSDIKPEHLHHTLADFWNKITIDSLINWLSKELYNGFISEKQLLNDKKLFFRYITK